MVAEGKGNDKADFGDLNQGEVDTFSIKAKYHIDFMDPKGPMVMQENASKLGKQTALMVVISKRDRAYKKRRGKKDYYFGMAQPHPKSSYKVVRGGHKATSRIAKDDIIEWLKSL